MEFPEIERFPTARPGPYERQMGVVIVRVLRELSGRVPDAVTHAHVLELASRPDRWTAAHAVFDAVRKRLIVAIEQRDGRRQSQYSFEESCCQAMYNATDPKDPFDAASPFFVAPAALALAHVLAIDTRSVVAALTNRSG